MKRKKVVVPFVGEKPKQATSGAIAADLYAAEDAIILPGETLKVRTTTKIAVPEGWGAYLNVRSSVGDKGIMLSNGTGVIDTDYRGYLILSLFNGNIKDFLMALSMGSVTFDYDNGSLYKPSVPGAVKISKGNRIGQLRIMEMPEVVFEEVKELSETDRGEGGFGSTGV